MSDIPTIITLGQPETVGELRKLIEGYSDDMSFGFRNQPIQVLIEVKYSDITFVCFQEKYPLMVEETDEDLKNEALAKYPQQDNEYFKGKRAGYFLGIKERRWKQK